MTRQNTPKREKRMSRMRFAAAVLAAAMMLAAPAFDDGPVAKAKDAVDPDCTPGKAAKGAAMKATVGVGNRCGVAETVRDTAGVDGGKPDGVPDGSQAGDGDGPLKVKKDD